MPYPTTHSVLLCLALAVSTLVQHDAHASSLRVSGSTTVNPVVSEAAEVLRAENDFTITIDTAGGSTGGINAVGDGRADVGMSSRGLNDSDREKFPSVHFHPVAIGHDAISIVVSKDVRDGGVKNLTADQLRGIYEGKITNWQELGGIDRRIVFFNKEPGRGTWEILAKWLYGKSESAPRASHPEVGANEEVRSKVAGTRGAISFVSTPWADNQRIFTLGINDKDGSVIEATTPNIASGTYPLSRPLFVITNGEPAGAAKVLVDYLLSPPGQELVARHGYLRLEDLE